MKFHIKATGFELTPALDQFIREKFGGLAKFLVRWERDNEVLIKIEVAKNTKHHNKGNVFYAEANLDLPKLMIRVEEMGEDLHAAIDKLKDRLKKELLRIKEKLADH